MLAAPPAFFEAAGLLASAVSLNVGEVWEQREFIHELPIRNQTLSEIKIVDVRVSCGCMAVEPVRMQVPPGGTATLRIAVNLFDRDRFEIGQPVRPFAFQVWPITEQSTSRNEGWKLTGTIRSRITLDAINIHFGEEQVLGQPPVVRRAIARVHAPLKDLQASIRPPQGVVSLRPDKSDRYILELSPSPSLPVGHFAGEVLLSATVDDGARRPVAILPFAGRIQPSIRILPASVTLAPQPVGSIAEAVVVLQAPTDVVPEVAQIEASTTDLTVVPVEVPGIASGRAFRITQRITTIGDSVATAVFVLRAGPNRDERIQVEIRSHGREAP